MTDKHAGGRPPKYTDDLPDKMLDFFNIESFYINEDGQPVVSKFPSFARFSLTVDITQQTLNVWQKETTKNNKGETVLKYPEFSSAYKKCKAAQEAYLYECGLAGVTDKTFTIWATKTLLGHREVQQIEISEKVKDSGGEDW